MPYGRRMSNRGRGQRAIIQSVKKQIVIGPQSALAGNTSFLLVKGQDQLSVPVEQDEAPTGAMVKYIECQISQQNLDQANATFTVVSMQKVHTGQVAIDPYTTGGNEQRNQVFHTIVRCVAPVQNSNIMVKFKVPKRYWRMRNGDEWRLTINNNLPVEQLIFVFYKYYT